MTIPRPAHERAIGLLLRQFPVVAMIGARQTGKTTPARQLAGTEESHYFDLEDPREAALMGHPKVGASWEGFAMSQVIAALGAETRQCHFWKLHTGAELDLLIARDGVRLGFEFKLSDSPRASASMRSALTDLKLDSLHVVHAGAHSFAMSDRIQALALTDVLTLPRVGGAGSQP